MRRLRKITGLMLCLTPLLTSAAPTGPNVVVGSAQFDQVSPRHLQITNQPGTIINWRSFGIAAGEHTEFLQNGQHSAVLNRVTGADLSQILGRLSSNGRVFLVNPNGVVVGDQARIDTQGLWISSLNITDEDFIQGHMHFDGGADSGDVVNHGHLLAGQGGEIVLIAPLVANHGVIEAKNGSIVLAAGQSITLESLDRAGIRVEIQAPTDQVLNLGKILADGGSAALIAGTLSNTGVVQANRVTRRDDGRLWLEASHEANISGALSVQGVSTRGGDISLTAPSVSLQMATLDASGDTGGGRIRIGGDYQGRALPHGAANADVVRSDHMMISPPEPMQTYPPGVA